MPMYPWWRFRSPDSSCLTSSDSGTNCTSHHLQCVQLKLRPTLKTSQQQARSAQKFTLNLWPSTTPPCISEEDSHSNLWTRQHDLRCLESGWWERSQRSPRTGRPSPVILSSMASLPRPPPRCRLPSMKFTTLLLYATLALIFLSSPTTAAPWITPRAANDSPLLWRQAIPDKTGETGNKPASVKGQPPPRPVTPSLSPSPSPGNPLPQPTIVTTGSTGSTNAPDQLGNSPRPLPTPLPLMSPTFPLSAGAIAGIAGGAVVLIFVVIFIGVWAFRRRRRLDISEIPIRRSKLGSRLGFRIFGDGLASRGSSRRGSNDSRNNSQNDSTEKQIEVGWLDKGTIGRPKPAWLEDGFLSVPKPGFLAEKRNDEDSAPWVEKFAISAPRPARPGSAEPLGRLSHKDPVALLASALCYGSSLFTFGDSSSSTIS
ncbi:uncharacterized protein BDR25DRAFT_353578 [Lindgomyces ingoldianus]|uniref:Uncharacterized protein n=1 Tax=Lindgomyces ingoldianus TaxID=673940 RepID=A0ACB6QZY0_9PLEO|nr:uncharacterized protein BDR25DRAFT_353578 [Lindgomyces ingoldianus]KAF2472544.1 hypothetical protein BDR25DRAFT_353578 [Lindgomyces ingoldianus]